MEKNLLFWCFPLPILLLQLSSLLLLSSAYTLPTQYFINCGSEGSIRLTDGRNFVGDVKSRTSSFTAGGTHVTSDENTSTALPPLYKTTRIYSKPSSYQLKTTQKGIYILRLHFYPFSSPKNLSQAVFDVWASGYYLLHNFSVQNTSKFPVIKEFYLNIKVEKFGINFAPSFKSSFAFVNAMDLFLAPETFIPDSARQINSSATTSNYSGLSSQVLKTIHRINMGGARLLLKTILYGEHGYLTMII